MVQKQGVKIVENEELVKKKSDLPVTIHYSLPTATACNTQFMKNSWYTRYNCKHNCKQGLRRFSCPGVVQKQEVRIAESGKWKVENEEW